MGVLDSFLQLLNVGQVLGFLKEHPAEGMAFGGLAGLLAFLVNVGPLKRINADTLVGKAIALALVIVMLLGVAWMVAEKLAGEVEEIRHGAAPRVIREGERPAEPAKSCRNWDGEASRCLD